MTDRGGRTRARDADRDQVVALLEAAFVDGQLDRADYDQRVGQALAAKTLGELEPLTHDLQSDEVDVTAESPRFGRRAALAAGLGLVLLGGAGWRLAHRDDEEEPAAVDPPPTPAAAADVSRPSPSPSPSPTPAPVDLFTVTGMRTLLAAIHSRFGTTAVYELTVRREHPDRADMTVPYGAVRKDRLQSFGWTQPDGFDDGDSPRTNTFGDRRFDLDRLDLARFRKNARLARQNLNVENPTSFFASIELGSTDDEPLVRFYVSNDLQESASLTTTLGGSRVSLDAFIPGVH